MAEGYFWGATLSGENGTATWDPEENLKSASDFSRGHSLTLKQAMLGPEAKKGEVNIVQVDTVGYQTDVKMPLFRLEAENLVQCPLDLTFPDAPVTFTLTKGSGPLHILGFHNVVSVIEEESEDDIDEEGEEIEGEEDEEGIVNGEKDAKKRKMGSAEKQKNKKAKMDEDIEDEDDDDFDLDEEEEKSQKKGKGTPGAAKQKKPVKAQGGKKT